MNLFTKHLGENGFKRIKKLIRTNFSTENIVYVTYPMLNAGIKPVVKINN